MSGLVTLFQEFFSAWNIMVRMPGDLQTGDNLSISFNRDRGFPELFSGLTGSPEIVMAGVRTGEPVRIYGGAVDLFAPVIERFHDTILSPYL